MLVWHYNIIHNGIGVISSAAMFSFFAYCLHQVKKLYVAPPCVLF